MLLKFFRCIWFLFYSRRCDFNIYAVDVANPMHSNQFKLPTPKGRIDDSVAKTICTAQFQFLQTNDIQGPLKHAVAFQGFTRKLPVEPWLCTNWEWNNCANITRCQKFKSAQCRVENKKFRNFQSSLQTNSRILEGHDAKPNQRPFQVRISVEIDDFVLPDACSGVIYNSMYILTTAKCCYERTACSLTIYAGDYSISRTEKTEQIRKVVSIMTHEKYVYDVDHHHDIALLKLSSPLSFSESVTAILLATREYPTTDSEVRFTELSGWGHITVSHKMSDILQVIELPIVSDCNCRLYNSIADSNRFSSNKICAGFLNHGICNGDEGGPWTITENGTKYLIGVSSFSVGCGLAEAPGFATKVLAYQDWIVMRAGSDIYIIHSNVYKF